MPVVCILVPYDFSADADAALRYARGLAQPFGARIHLVHVVDDPIAAGMSLSDCCTVELADLHISLAVRT